MSEKSVLYIIAGIVLIVFIQSFRDVAVEFVKGTNAEESSPFPGMLMIPGPQQQKFRNDIVEG